MPPVQASAPAPPGGVFPSCFLAASGPDTTNVPVFHNGDPQALAVVTQIDFTVTGGAGPQLFVQFRLISASQGNVSFYYDSQSLGEGNGLWFSWRGALPVIQGNSLTVIFATTGPMTWGAVISGWWQPAARQFGA